MADAALRGLWKDVEAELRSGIDNLAAINPRANFESAKSFLEHNELLLACEQIEDAIDVQSLNSSTSIRENLANARRLMDVPSEEQNQ